MALHDITVPITADLVTWPGDPGIELKRVADRANGDSCTVTRITMGVHTGTHIDGQMHFVDGPGTDALTLERLIGLCQVIELTTDAAITAADLAQADIDQDCQRLLIKTKNSQRWADPTAAFDQDYVALAPNGAQWLVDNGIDLVGVDYLSVAPFTDTTTTHLVVLGADVIVIEGLDLRAITPGNYRLLCLPMALQGCDGAPTRCVLEDV